MNDGLPQLRAARIAAGLTLVDAGRAIGKSASHLSKIERGAVTLLFVDAVALARRYGVPVETFSPRPDNVTA